MSGANLLKENEQLQIEIVDLKSKLSQEHNKIQELNKQINDLNLGKNNEWGL